eukprot:TRINITY_DN14427_c0_g1_i1.p1 TRINITY_DN14427_c0_g1~~TRINITY_DN14427_c0_g1_i1.p1  ORF type:complete len:272 (+),score=34.19 TRINITY_DN14427_c0_g1_i1:60-875(+)
MKLLSSVLLSLTAVSLGSSNRSVGWYMPWNFDISWVKDNVDVVDRINLCCSQFAVEANGTFKTKISNEFVENVSEQVRSLDIEFVVMGGLNETAVLTETSLNAIPDIVSYVKLVKAMGIIFDYEPKNNFSTTHASKYAKFLSKMKQAAGDDFQVGMDVSGWGILDMFPIYAPSSLDIYTSMATTYYMNSAVSPKGHQFVSNMTSYFGNSSRFGIGSTATMSTGQHCSYNWTANTLAPYLNQLPYRAVDIYPCDFDHRGSLDPSFLEVFRNW